jgi:hypothetical protein
VRQSEERFFPVLSLTFAILEQIVKD